MSLTKRSVLGADGSVVSDVPDVPDVPLGAWRRELEPLAFAPLQEGTCARHDLLHVDRLDHEVVRAGLQAPRLALQPRLGDEHHRRRKPLARLLDPAAERQPLRIGGSGNHQVGTVGEPLQRFFGGAGEANGETCVP